MPRFQRRFLLAILVLVIGAVLAFAFSPALIARGIRAYVWWQTRGEMVMVQIDRIEAPFFRPVVMQGVRLQTTPNAAWRIDLAVKQLTLSFNFESILLRTRDRAIRSLSVEGLHIEANRRGAGAAISENQWNALQRLLPESFDVAPFDVRVEDGSSILLTRNVSLTGSPVEAGRFRADEIVIASPLFRQTFTGLRGASKWQDNRLTLAGMTLSHGLDIQWVTADLSRIGRRRMTLEFDLDTFGGKVRGSVSNEWRSRHSNWNVAGSANDISLSQTAEAIGFTNRLDGLLHAGKFTFRGDPALPLRATASLWAELTSPAWGDREADVIMLGVSLYNRRVGVQQLYIQQRKNQLTLSGEATFPTTTSDWWHPEFHGNISAAIDDLGEFATLFGAERKDFAGRITIEGTMNAGNRNIGSNLSVNGTDLRIFQNSVDLLTAQVTLKSSTLEVEQLDLKHKNDWLQARGAIETSSEHNYSGSIDASVRNLGDYLSTFCKGADAKPAAADLHATITSGVWDAAGTIDPPTSSPLRFTAHFPLQIRSGLDPLWIAPIKINLEFPALLVGELPECVTGGFLRSGTLTGKISITETLTHPSLSGELRLFGGRPAKSSGNLKRVDGHIAFHGHQATVSFLNLNADPGNISLFGDLDFQNPNDLLVRLRPAEPILDVDNSALTIPTNECINRLEVLPVPETTATPAPIPAPAIAQLELRGPAWRSGWTINLREPDWNSGFAALDWDFTARKLLFCSGAGGEGKALKLGLKVGAPSKPVRRHRSRR